MNTITLTRPCPFCRESHSITVDREKYAIGMVRLQEGAKIQDAFPSFTLDEREWIKTGICPTCWEKMMTSELGY